MNPQRCERKLVSANKETKAEHSTDSFTYINNINLSTDEEASGAFFDGYDAEYYDDERFEIFHSDFKESYYIQTVRYHDEYIARHN